MIGLGSDKNRRKICQEEIDYFCILFNGWIYFRTWEVSKISNRFQFTHLMLKICINKKGTITIYTLYETCRGAVRCSAFLSSITFPIYFRNGMQHRWLMLSSFSRTFIYWSRIWRKIEYFGTGWQNLAAFRREQKWHWKFPSNAFLQFSRQMRRFCAQSQICKINSVKYAIYTI